MFHGSAFIYKNPQTDTLFWRIYLRDRKGRALPTYILCVVEGNQKGWESRAQSSVPDATLLMREKQESMKKKMMNWFFNLFLCLLLTIIRKFLFFLILYIFLYFMANCLSCLSKAASETDKQ